MDHAEEFAFAWALLDAAGTFLDRSARSWMCAKLGAGEIRSVIGDLLAGFVSSETALPVDVASSLWSWVDGFRGSNAESSIRETVSRLRLASSGPGDAPAVMPAARLVARSSDHIDGVTLVLVPAGP